MIKTNIKMRVTPEQLKNIAVILNKVFFSYEHKYIFIKSNDIIELNSDERYFNNYPYEEIDTDLFIKTNGTCEEDFRKHYNCKCVPPEMNEETYLTKYTSQPKDLESALKKIENLHIALNKKVEKNKNQALEITKLLEQKKYLQEALNINYGLIEELTKIGVKYENKFDENKKTIERLNSIVEYLTKQLGLKVF